MQVSVNIIHHNIQGFNTLNAFFLQMYTNKKRKMIVAKIHKLWYNKQCMQLYIPLFYTLRHMNIQKHFMRKGMVYERLVFSKKKYG